MNTRKIVQIAIDPSREVHGSPYIYALCVDGTLWRKWDGPDGDWYQLPPIPQATEPPTETTND